MSKHTLPPTRPILGIYTHDPNVITHLTALAPDFHSIQLHPQKFDPHQSIDYCLINLASLIDASTGKFTPDLLLSQLKIQTNVSKIIILLPTLILVEDANVGQQLSASISSLVSRLEMHFPQKIRLLLLEADLCLTDNHLSQGLLTQLTASSASVSLHPSDQVRPWGVINLNHLWPIVQQLLVGFYPGTYNLKISAYPSQPLINWLLPFSHHPTPLAFLLHLSLPQQQVLELHGVGPQAVIMPNPTIMNTSKPKPKKPKKSPSKRSSPKLKLLKIIFSVFIPIFLFVITTFFLILQSQSALKRTQWQATSLIKSLPLPESFQYQLNSHFQAVLSPLLKRQQDSQYQKLLENLTQSRTNLESANHLDSLINLKLNQTQTAPNPTSLKKYSPASVINQSLSPLISLLRLNTPLKIAIVGLNSAEIRPGGGLIEAVITGTITGGTLSNTTYYTTAKLDGMLGGVVEPPPLIEQHLKQSRFYLRDANISITTQENARQTAWFLEKEINYIPDVVIFITRQSITGAQLLNDQAIWENFYQILNTKESVPASYTSLIDQILEYLGRGEIQIATHPLNWPEIYNSTPSSCSLQNCYHLPLYVSELNTGLNHANTEVTRALAQTIEMTASGLIQTVQLTLNHQGKGEWPSGEYQALASVVQLPQSSLLSIKAGDSYLTKAQITITPDQSGDRLWVPLRLKPGSSMVIEWVISHPVQADSVWGTITKQPGITPYPITLNITPPGSFITEGIWSGNSELNTTVSFYVDSQTGLW